MNFLAGNKMYALIERLFPICRSLTGDGVRQTLDILRAESISHLELRSIPSGTQCFDWVIPKEWNIYDAYIIDPDGRKIIDFKKNNLHVVSYSTPIDSMMSLEALQSHLHSIPEMPTAIPYVTSYYKERWGFCLSHNQRDALKDGNYRVVIDSKLEPGELNYGEIIIPGSSDKEVFLSTYVCHPSMCNNELSGPAVTMALSNWISSLSHRKYTYRIVFIPETIGSIAYLSEENRYLHLRKNVIAGFNISCVGDNRAYSYLPSRRGDTLSDLVVKHVLRHIAPDYRSYTFKDRGSDERQYCSPGIDLPIASLMRTKYGAYPEYHTSLDNLDLVSAEGLEGAYVALKKCIEIIEGDAIYKSKTLCEPQLGKRGLYPSVGGKREDAIPLRAIMDLLAYSDGEHSLLNIAENLNISFFDLKQAADILIRHDLLEKIHRNVKTEKENECASL